MLQVQVGQFDMNLTHKKPFAANFVDFKLGKIIIEVLMSDQTLIKYKKRVYRMIIIVPCYIIILCICMLPINIMSFSILQNLPLWLMLKLLCFREPPLLSPLPGAARLLE